MKSYSRGMLAASLLMAGGAAWAHKVTFDAGYHGGFDVTTIDETVLLLDSEGQPSVANVSNPVSAEGSEYVFEKWEQVSKPLTEDVRVKAIYRKSVTVKKDSRALIGFSLQPDVDNTGVLDDLVTDIDIFVRDFNGQHVRQINGELVNNIGMIQKGQGYFVSNGSAADVSTTITGTSFDLGETISLSEGYNVVPFMFESGMATERYFSTILGAVEFIQSIDGKRYPSDSNTLETLTKDNAYLVKMNEADTLTLMPPVPVDETVNTEALLNGGTIVVTSPYDSDIVDDSIEWTTAVADGLTLREAIYFASTLVEDTGDLPETISFASNILAVFLQDELVVSKGNFTINGDFDGNNIEDVVITRADSSVKHRFINITSEADFVALNGIAVTNFEAVSTDNSGGVYIDKVPVTISYCTFEDIAGQLTGVVINAKQSQLTISWTEFINVSAKNSSASSVITTQGGHLDISNSYFKECSTIDGSGPLFYIQNDTDAKIATSTFEDCGTAGIGAERPFKLRASWDDSHAKLSVMDSTFINNKFSSFTELSVDTSTEAKADNTADIIFDNISAYGNVDDSDVEVLIDLADLADLDGNTKSVDYDNDSHNKEIVDGVTFVDTESELGAYAAYLYERNDSPVYVSGLSDLLLTIDSTPTVLTPVFTDYDSVARYEMILDPTNTGISINEFSGIITIDEQQFAVGDTITVSVVAEDIFGKPSQPKTFTVEFINDLPTTPDTAPAKGTDLEVTIGADVVADSELAAIAAAAADIDEKWDEIKDGGLTLREAIWFVGQRADGTAESITFHDSLSTIELKDQLAVSTGKFTIDGDLDNDADHEEDITITNAAGSVSRFMAIDGGEVTVEGLILDGFNDNSCSVFYVYMPTTAVAKLFVKYSTIKNNISSNGPAIFVRKGTFAAQATVSWTEFVNNDGKQLLKAHANGSPITIDSSYFAENTATDLGLFVSTYGKFTMTNSTVVSADSDSDLVHYTTGTNIGAFSNNTFVDLPYASFGSLTADEDILEETFLHYTTAEADGRETTINGVRFLESDAGETKGAYAAVNP